MKSSKKTLILFAAAIAATAVLSSALTVLLQNSKGTDSVLLPTEEYEKLKESSVISEIADRIESDFFGDIPERERLIHSAAKGMVASLGDPYANYYTDEEYEIYMKKLEGEYSGIGALVSQPDGNGSLVLEVFENGPAEKAGLVPGDIIVRVDGTDVGGKSLEDLSAMIFGEDGTIVILTVQRGEKREELSVKRGIVNAKRVHHALYNEKTGYIRIDMFTGNCAEEFSRAVKDLTERGMRSLVIDIRNNPGGILDDVVSICDTLLGEGVIVTVKRGAGSEEVFKSDKIGVSVPIAVLTNGNSASASEILAAAVQDSEAGVIVGTKTYGKGVVQTTMRLDSNKAWLKITTAAYYTPSGRNINGVGVTPDIDVELADGVKSIPLSRLDQKDDAQLWAALDYVRDKANDIKNG
ncbi:MAG: putative CtpA-like serine protease [Firmicutes bacterium ADurb.Bin182]|nr:MAG: putative CtpA-like serine protease [Firmicutes bacterium ADurb.Bin182]